MKQNNPRYLFGMYEPDTDSVIVNSINDIYADTPIVIGCEECNLGILLDTPDDIVYLYRLAQENPLLYAELACKPNGFQEYLKKYYICVSLTALKNILRSVRLRFTIPQLHISLPLINHR